MNFGDAQRYAARWRGESIGRDLMCPRDTRGVALALYLREMGSGEAIEITFDFRSDTPPGKDPDTFSPTLRRYHQLLWSKPLPGGSRSSSESTGPPYYLHHRSELGEFWLSSDAVVPSFRWLALIVEQVPEVEREEFKRFRRSSSAGHQRGRALSRRSRFSTAGSSEDETNRLCARVFERALTVLAPVAAHAGSARLAAVDHVEHRASAA